MTVLVIGLVIGLVVGCLVRSARVAAWSDARGRRATDRAVGSERLLPGDLPVAWADLDEVVGRHRVGVVLLGEHADVLYRNRAAMGFSGTHVGVLLDEVIERLGAAAREGGARRETVEFYGPPRSVFVLDAHAVGGGRAVVFVDDVSEARRVERMRTDFVTNISHELKTPIGALSVLAETLVDEVDVSTIGRVVERMVAEAARAARTVDDLLELSRIELSGIDVSQTSGGSGDGDGTPASEAVTVDQLVASALGRVTELALRRAIGVTALAAVDESGRSVGDTLLRGDRRQLESALGNLVENAVRYSSDGGSVQVRAAIDGDVVEFAVIDHGIGIPQRDLDRIFERFYRVDRARSRDTGGTGLGLSIVRHVAGNHGGSVSVRSIEGEGSTFVLSLPIVVRERAAEQEGVA